MFHRQSSLDYVCRTQVSYQYKSYQLGKNTKIDSIHSANTPVTCFNHWTLAVLDLLRESLTM